MTVAHAPDVTEVVRLALSGVHVNVTGPRGSDLSGTVAEITRRLEDRGAEVVVIEATAEMSSTSFGALRLALPEAFTDARDPAAIIDRLCAHVLSATEPSIVIRNIDQLDPFSLRAISEMLRRTQARLVSTLSAATARFPDALMTYAHVQVVVRSLSHLELETWLTPMTDHPLDQELVTRLYIDSRGRPTFARALFLSGIREHQIVLRGGFWSLAVGELWTSEVSFAVASVLSSLPDPLLECLRTIGLETTPTVTSLAERVSSATLAALEREGLIGIIRAPGQDSLVTVSPPVIARYLDAQAGGALAALRPRPEMLEAELDEESVLSIELTRATQRRAAEADAEFAAHPGAATLIMLIHSMWARGATYSEVEALLRAPRDVGDEEQELEVVVLHAHWLSFGAGRFEEAITLLDNAIQTLSPPMRRCAQAHRLTIEIHWHGVTAESRAELATLTDFPEELLGGRLARIAAAMVHFLGGRARTAIRMLGDKPEEPELLPLWIFTSGYALLTADRPAEAVAIASEELARGRDELDPDVVFVSSFVLVAAHMFEGNWGQAQRLARAVRAIGRPNLYTMPVYRTTVGIQAIVFAEEGDSTTAGGLMQQVTRPGGTSPIVFAQPEMPSVVSLLAQRDYDALSRVLARIAAYSTVTGSDYAASYLWSFAMALDPTLHPSSHPPGADDELDAYSRVRDFIGVVLADDLDRTTAIAQAYPQSTFAYLAGLALIRWGQRVAATDPQRGAAYAALADELYSRLSIPPPEKVIEGPVPVLGLSPRELQVALFAGRLTNREIAERLGISERTVDHHVSNSLKKSGARNRRELSVLVARIHGEW